jgi:hypothetical protein
LYVRFQIIGSITPEEKRCPVRPAPLDLLATLRTSLNDTLLPAIEDRWARYVANAMDLVLQHLELRLAGELDSLAEDSADMATTLADVVQRASSAGPGWTGLGALVPEAGSAPSPLDEATAHNERLRSVVVEVIQWLDAHEPGLDPPAVEEVREALMQLVRRQLDRASTFVEPLFMSFGPAAS